MLQVIIRGDQSFSPILIVSIQYLKKGLTDKFKFSVSR